MESGVVGGLTEGRLAGVSNADVGGATDGRSSDVWETGGGGMTDGRLADKGAVAATAEVSPAGDMIVSCLPDSDDIGSFDVRVLMTFAAAPFPVAPGKLPPTSFATGFDSSASTLALTFDLFLAASSGFGANSEKMFHGPLSFRAPVGDSGVRAIPLIGGGRRKN